MWALSDPERLGRLARRVLEDPASEALASAASVWEIAIKASLGKIDFPLSELAPSLSAAGLGELPVDVRHATAVRHLPAHHRDPFDRMLVAQALVEGLVLVTRDRELGAYGVRTVWD